MVKRESSYHTKNINQVLRVKMDPLSEEILWAAVSRCLLLVWWWRLFFSQGFAQAAAPLSAFALRRKQKAARATR